MGARDAGRLGRSWQREDEARSDEQRRGEAVDTQSLPELPAVGEDDQCVGGRGDRRRDEHPAKRRGTAGGPGDEQYHAGGDVAGSLDLGETAEVVCGDPEVEGRLAGLKDEASAEDDDRETCDECDQQSGEMHADATFLASPELTATLYPNMEARQVDAGDPAIRSTGWPSPHVVRKTPLRLPEARPGGARGRCRRLNA